MTTVDCTDPNTLIHIADDTEKPNPLIPPNDQIYYQSQGAPLSACVDYYTALFAKKGYVPCPEHQRVDDGAICVTSLAEHLYPGQGKQYTITFRKEGRGRYYYKHACISMYRMDSGNYELVHYAA